MKSLIYILFLSVVCIESHAQIGGGGQSTYKPFNPVPASPNVAAFEKYGNIPVNINTGMPSVQIPLAEIEFSDFSWPVTLSYHASGFKSEDRASRQGLGWTLMANGVISGNQTALNVGSPLELRRYLNLQFVPLRGECGPVNETDIHLADGLASGLYSTEQAIFDLNSATVSAKFLADGKCLPAKDLEITHQGLFGFTPINWTVKDGNGNVYEFFLTGTNTRTSDCQGLISGPANIQSYLTRIITANGNTISFVYAMESFEYSLPPTLVKKFNPDFQSNCNATYPSEEYWCQNTYSASERRLERIEASNGMVISFSYSGRLDFAGSTKLDRVTINYRQSLTEQTRKVIDFEYDYFLTEPYENFGTDRQLKLNALSVKGEDGVSIQQRYTFGYNSMLLPNKMSPSISFTNLTYTTAIYNISEAGILSRINHPTGGYTTFSYEVLQGYGTLRLRELRDFNFDNSLASAKSYEYNDVPPSYIQAVFSETESNFFFGNPDGSNPQFCISFDPCVWPRGYWLQRCDRVVVRNSPVRNTYQDYTNNSVRFPFVTEINGMSGAGGKTEFLYAKPGGNRSYNDVFYLEENLVEKRVFRKQGASQYVLVSRSKYNYRTAESSSYDFFGDPEVPLESRYWIKRVKIERPEMRLECCDLPGSTDCYPTEYLQSDFRLASVPVYLMSTEEESIEEGRSIVRTTNYVYGNPSRLNPTSVQYIDSKRDLISIDYRYAYDFSSVPVYAEMTNRNMVSQKIEEIKRNVTKGVELSKSVTEYGFWHNNARIFVNRQRSSVGGSTSLQDMVVFERYSLFGNVEQYLLKDGQRYAILWGYEDRLPVAKVQGGQYSSVVSGSGVTLSVLANPSNDNVLRFELNKLRTLPGLFVETFTYKPLFGKTSEADINNRLTYYEYDALGRLIRIRDNDNRIIKAFNYRIYGQ